MTLPPRVAFVDGLRVTAQHLNHAEDSALLAIEDLRAVLGRGRIGAGLRITVGGGGALTLSPGIAFTADGSPVRLDGPSPVTLPAAPASGPFTVLLRSSTAESTTTGATRVQTSSQLRERRLTTISWPST